MRVALLVALWAGGLFAAEAMPPAHFHHIHLNAADPAAAIRFYTSKFDCERAKFAGEWDGVWAQKAWILFNQVQSAPPSAITSAIWHFGWGAEDMKAEYQKQLDSGTKFDTPITDISDLANFPGFYYAYVDGPDHALIELNTAAHHHLGHVHLLSADPIAAGEWYMKYFGATRRGKDPPSREPAFYKGYQVGPGMSLMSDNINIIIFPMEFAKKAYADSWRDRTAFEPTEGRVVDHIGFSFENLGDALDRMRKDGVKVMQEIQTAFHGKVKYAFIEGPDKIRIELVEGQARKE
ncbi:MAG TPA: VOC family protein [Bryobacteraceae bacterium]|nr:VOC family protein [Bryobacteraceae bacterium]